MIDEPGLPPLPLPSPVVWAHRMAVVRARCRCYEVYHAEPRLRAGVVVECHQDTNSYDVGFQIGGRFYKVGQSVSGDGGKGQDKERR